MNSFLMKNYLCFLGLILLATYSNAMHKPTQDPLLFCASLINQQLNQQCLFQQQFIQYAKMDNLVVQAIKILKSEKVMTPLAISLLQAAKGHPEAEYLLDPTTENELNFQKYRLYKGSEALLVLQNIQASDSNSRCMLSGNSDAYTLFTDILNHPVHTASADKTVRGHAAYCLGHMCLDGLGVPLTFATPAKAREYFNQALACGHPLAQEMRDNLANQCDKQPQPSQVTASQPDATAKDQLTTPIKHQEQQVPTPQPEQVQQLKQIVQKSSTSIQPSTTVGQLIETEQLQNEKQECPQKTYAAAASTTPVTLPETIATQNIPAQKIASKPAKQPREHHEVPCQTKPTPKAIAIHDQPKPTEAAFTISEDPSMQVQESLLLFPRGLPPSSRKPAPKKKYVTKKQDKSKKDASPKVETIGDSTKHKKVATQQKPPVNTRNTEKKEAPKKEKLEKKKHKESSESVQTISQAQEKEETKKAYTLVTKLIQHYLGTLEKSVLILTDILNESENWKTAQATYKGAYRLLDKKYKIDTTNSELMGILQYLQGNVQEAGKTIIKSNRPDFATHWYKALVLFAIEPETPERNKTILEIVDELQNYLIEQFKVVKEVLFQNVKFTEFINAIYSHDCTDLAIVRTLRIKLLFGGELRENSAEAAALMHAHEQGSIEASTLLAQMYMFGRFFEQSQSLQKAIAILKTSIESDKNNSISRIVLLTTISKFATEKRDSISSLKANYLEIVEIAKNNEFITPIINLLVTTEEKISTVDKSQKAEAADLFVTSGAYKALLPIAQQSEEVLLKVCEIVSCREKTHSHPQEKYEEMHSLASNHHEKFTKWQNAYGFIKNLISQYHLENEKTLLNELTAQEKFKKTLFTGHTVQDVYNDTRELLEKSNLEHNRLYDELMTVLYYLQNNLQAAKQYIVKYNETDAEASVTEWYRALILLETESDTPERNQLILNALETFTDGSLGGYLILKPICIFNKRLIDLVNEQSLTSSQASLIRARLGILFGCQSVGIKPEDILTHIRSSHERENINSSGHLVEMYMYGMQTQKSLPDALSVLQKVMERSEKSSDVVSMLLCKMHTRIMASETAEHDPISFIHAVYLEIVEIAKNSGENSIIKTLESEAYIIKVLETTEYQLSCHNITQEEQAKAAELLVSSGAYKALLLLAQQHPQIAPKLYNCALDRVTRFNHPREWYREIFELEAAQQSKRSNDIDEHKQ